MGEVVEVGTGNTKLKVGDRVVVPFVIACGAVLLLQAAAVRGVRQLESRRDRGHVGADLWLSDDGRVRLFASDRRLCGRPGGIRARAVLRCGADRDSSDGIDDDKVLFLSDILPTGWMAAVNCEIEPRRRRGGVGLWPRWSVRRFRARSCWARIG